jgi:hypothetical protein
MSGKMLLSISQLLDNIQKTCPNGTRPLTLPGAFLNRRPKRATKLDLHFRRPIAKAMGCEHDVNLHRAV